MKIFYANMAAAKGFEKWFPHKIDILDSFYGKKSIQKSLFCKDLFLDSGAFSAQRKKEKLCVRKYCEFIKTYSKLFFCYANLDVIGDPIESFANFEEMSKVGLNAIPCFHYGEPFYFLEKYLDAAPYVALGGTVPISKNESQILSFLDKCWTIIMKQTPNIKIHGFGVNNEKIMIRYPWFSIDASSIHMQARYGGIRSPWGWVKVNPNVNSNEAQWQIFKKNELKKVSDWVEGLNLSFSFDSIRQATNESVLKRCCVSISYYEMLRKKKTQYKPKKIGLLV